MDGRHADGRRYVFLFAADRRLRLMLVGALLLAATVSSIIAVQARVRAVGCVVAAASTDVPVSVVGYSCRWVRTLVDALPLAVGIAASATAGVVIARSRTSGPQVGDIARQRRARRRPMRTPWPEGLWWRLSLVPVSSFIALLLAEMTLVGFLTDSPVEVSPADNIPPAGVPELDTTAQAGLFATLLAGLGLVAWWQWSLIRDRAASGAGLS